MLATSVGLVAWGVPDAARAGIDACGNIHVEANAECEVVVEGGCQAMCEPIRFEAACAARLQAACVGQCNADIEAGCQATCESTCFADCDVDPGQLSCRGACNADCQGACDAECGSGQSECRAACEATCSARCEGQCEAVPPSAECEAKCEAACDGSCQAKANIDCQIECQAMGFVECEAELEGGCVADCESPRGALFCDGQYVDYGNNLEECVEALRTILNVEVEGYADAECREGECAAEAGGSISCGVDPKAPARGPMFLLSVLVAAGASLLGRRAATERD